MKSLSIPHDFGYDSASSYPAYNTNNYGDDTCPRNGQMIAITIYKCKRCGFTVEIKNHDVLQNILALTQATCELRYEDVRNLLNYMTVEEIHNS